MFPNDFLYFVLVLFLFAVAKFSVSFFFPFFSVFKKMGKEEFQSGKTFDVVLNFLRMI